MIFVEVIANPSMAMPNLAEISELANRKQMIFVEVIANPSMAMPNLAEISELANRKQVRFGVPQGSRAK
ncbi:hypothetical protein GCK32_021338 [Trichostrongylus colubriformis]|uniref:Uncharacterized protein n=1 Tax=Trichostrongylus colubriformis TaxID=6319 RepID=A0AAN8FYT2_TRICO